MPGPPTPTQHRYLPALVLALGLAMLVLLWQFWHVWRLVEFELEASKITGSLVPGKMLFTALAGPLAGFAAAAVALHLGLGLLAWVVAWAWPARRGAGGAHESLRVVIAFGLLAATAWLANATWFPASRFADEESWLLRDWHGLRPVHLPLALCLAGIACAGWRSLQRLPRRRLAAGAGLLAAFLLLAAAVRTGPDAGVADPDRPNVILIGVDSLRDNFAGNASRERLTPNIDEFLQGAHRFRDTLTPFARTYPAWVALLSGRHPVTTGARFNLVPREQVHTGETLGHVLQRAGYHAVYATDEVRFANFDESFGFDRMITPPVGAVDFILGTVGDLPLVNLATMLPLADWLFPVNRGNRAAHVTYRPGHFVARLRRELPAAQPGFYVIHLALSHWPYSWAGLPTPTTPQEYRPAFKRAVAEVDRQFGAVMELLRERGLLEQAIVVVLSDHGEALGWPDDTMLRETGSADDIWNSIWGHGTSVMSPHQYQVLLAMRDYGHPRLPGTPGLHDWPVTLEDVRPTLESLVTGHDPVGGDGLSLLPALADPIAAAELRTRIRYTETGFNTAMVMRGQYSTSGLLQEGAPYYELAPARGWVQLRADRLPELVSRKQRAAISATHLLAAIPDWDDGSVTYLLTKRRAPFPVRLDGRPDPATQPEGARLWDALHARFAGELAPQRPDGAM